MAVDTARKILSLRLAWAIVRLFNSNNPVEPDTNEKCYRVTVLASLTGDYSLLGMQPLLVQGEKVVGKHLNYSRNDMSNN